MALNPRDFPITRDDVAGWIKDYKAKSNPGVSLEYYVRSQIKAKAFPDDMVNTTAHDDLTDQTHIADLIVRDLDSYG